MPEGQAISEIPHKENIYSYGSAVLQLTYTGVDQYWFQDPAIAFRLGNHSISLLHIPDSPARREAPDFFAQTPNLSVSRHFGSNYSPTYHSVSYSEDDLQTRFGSVAFMEEYQHSLLLHNLNEQILSIHSRRPFYSLPDRLKGLPGLSEKAIRREMRGIQDRAAILDDGWMMGAHLDRGGRELLFIQEIVAKRETIQELLRWSDGNLERFLGENPATEYVGDLRKDFFEWYYLTMLGRAQYSEDVEWFSCGLPIPSQFRLITYADFGYDETKLKKAIKARRQYIETGTYEPDMETEAKTSFVPDSYQETALYRYWFL